MIIRVQAYFPIKINLLETSKDIKSKRTEHNLPDVVPKSFISS